MASLGALGDMMPLSERERRIMSCFGIVGRAAELAAGMAVEREAAAVKTVAAPLHQGLPGALWKAAKILTVSSLALAVMPGKSRGAHVASGALGVLGGLTLRFAIFHAGKASSLNPRATFRQQRGVPANTETQRHGEPLLDTVRAR
jgi:hypothetical protein